jgi:hypothetical protein
MLLLQPALPPFAAGAKFEDGRIQCMQITLPLSYQTQGSIHSTPAFSMAVIGLRTVFFLRRIQIDWFENSHR